MGSQAIDNSDTEVDNEEHTSYVFLSCFGLPCKKP